MLRRPAATFALLTLLAAVPARAQRPDPSFGVGGRLVYGVPDTLPAYLPVAALVPLPDGQFLTVGAGSMMRFSADGRRDRAFGQNGRVRETRIRGAIRDARIDDAGRIVAAGEEVLAVFESCGDDIESDFAAARFDAEGRVDSTFGRDGGVRVDFPRPLVFAGAAPQAPGTGAGACGAPSAEMTDDMAFRIVIGDGGTVTLAGRTSTLRGRAYGALARLDATGRLDPTFGTGGRVVLPGSFPRALGGLAALPDGGYIASGAVPGVGIGVVRLLSDGRLDPSFGRGGLAVVPVAGFDEDPRSGGGALARLPDGGAAVAGVVGGEIVVVRVDAQGLPDARFGAAGIVRLPANGARVTALGADALGRFVMTGQIGRSAFLMRLSSGGAVEISRPLETGGDAGAASIGTALLLRADGSVVVGGGVWSMPGGLPRLDAFVAVVGADGVTGHVEIVRETTLEARDERVTALAAVEGGAVLVGGDRNGSAFLLRLSEGGTPERFIVPLVPRTLPDRASELPTLDALDDGHVLGVGIWQGTLRRLIVTNTGMLVSSGPLGATAAAPSGAQPSSGRGRSARRPGGGVVVAGTVRNGDGRTDLAVVWLDAVGQPDERFGPGGTRQYDLRATGGPAPAGGPDTPVSIAVDGADRVLVGGVLGGEAGILRLTADGAIDTGFGVGGVARGVTGAPGDDPIGRVALFANDAGTVFALDRDGAGVRVTQYDADGRVTRSTVAVSPIGILVPSRARRLRSGALLVGGALYTSTGLPEAALMWLLPDGTADAAFGSGGVYRTGQLGTVDALAEDAKGRILVGITGRGDAIILRLLPPTATGAEPGARTTSGLRLDTPFPNPTRGAVTLRLTLDRPGPARLVVVDALGREVARLLDADAAAGTHAATLDTAALPPGLYLVRLSVAGIGAATRPLVVVR